MLVGLDAAAVTWCRPRWSSRLRRCTRPAPLRRHRRSARAHDGDSSAYGRRTPGRGRDHGRGRGRWWSAVLIEALLEIMARTVHESQPAAIGCRSILDAGWEVAWTTTTGSARRDTVCIRSSAVALPTRPLAPEGSPTMAPTLTRRRALGLGCRAARRRGRVGHRDRSAEPIAVPPALHRRAGRPRRRPGSARATRSAWRCTSTRASAKASRAWTPTSTRPTRAGIDVIWWTEHDFRVQSHGYRAGGPLRGPGRGRARASTGPGTRSRDGELARREPGRSSTSRTRRTSRARRCACARPARATTGASLTLRGRGLELDVLDLPRRHHRRARRARPSRSAPDAELVVEILSSYRPARARSTGRAVRAAVPRRPAARADHRGRRPASA